MSVEYREGVMQEFIRKHEARIHGVLSCFDRMLFRGYLPIMSGWSMAQFLNGLDVAGGSLKPFLLENAERVKDHAIAMAKKYERPFQYLATLFERRTRLGNWRSAMALTMGWCVSSPSSSP